MSTANELDAVSAGGVRWVSDAARRRRDDEDTAVVVALLASLSGTPTPAPLDRRTLWGNPAFGLGAMTPNGKDAWWASGLPR